MRINWIEAEEPIQIKLTLTAAKVAINPEGEQPTSIDTSDVPFDIEPTNTAHVKVPDEITEEEKERLRQLLTTLNI